MRQILKQIRRRGWPLAGGLLLVVAGCEREVPVGVQTLAPGVIYESGRMADGGMFHVVTVSLAEPGLRLYVTPPDAGAVRQGHEYRLARVQTVAAAERLAVCINAAFFTADARWLAQEGDLATGMTLASSDGDLARVDSNGRAFWFDGQNRLTVEATRAPWKIPAGTCKVAVGGYELSAKAGKVNDWVDRPADRVTLMATGADRSTLILAVFDQSTMLDATRALLERGASDVMMLDGGDSTAMSVVLPGEASPSVLLHGRPVATHFGVAVGAP